MALYIFIAVVILGLIVFGFWAAGFRKKQLKLREDFFLSPPVKALIDSGFERDINGVYGRLNGYDIGLYVWFEPGNTRYFTYAYCEVPSDWSFSRRFYAQYRTSEGISTERNTIRQELKAIDGDLLAQSFTRLLEVAAAENLKPRAPRPTGILVEH